MTILASVVALHASALGWPKLPFLKPKLPPPTTIDPVFDVLELLKIAFDGTGARCSCLVSVCTRCM